MARSYLRPSEAGWLLLAKCIYGLQVDPCHPQLELGVQRELHPIAPPTDCQPLPKVQTGTA